MSTRHAAVFEHVPNEKAGTLGVFLRRERIPFREYPLYDPSTTLPDLERVRCLIVMGGPMNVYEEDKHSFLRPETALIARAVASDIPYLGVCLGSQLLAKALGAKVYQAKAPEVGWMPVDLTKESHSDTVFAAAPSPLSVLQWHEDTFDLPDGARLLAASRLVPHQAFRYGASAYGLQFHVEADRPMLEDWFAKREDRNSILEFHDRYLPELSRITDAMYRRFFALSETRA